MLYLGYTFRATDHAQRHLTELWQWMQIREPWFYHGLQMVRSSSWRTEHVAEADGTRLLIHHQVELDDESALVAYRRAIATKSQDPAWEARRVEQDLWYSIVARTIQSGPPVRMGFRHVLLGG